MKSEVLPYAYERVREHESEFDLGFDDPNDHFYDLESRFDDLADLFDGDSDALAHIEGCINEVVEAKKRIKEKEFEEEYKDWEYDADG
jgi:hypothetical protein